MIAYLEPPTIPPELTITAYRRAREARRRPRTRRPRVLSDRDVREEMLRRRPS
jgi:hypothetical protein